MAETLDISQMLANSYEPKRKFRWILEIDGIDSFTATTAKRPAKTHEQITIDYINQKRYLAGKGEWQTIEIMLNDPIAPSARQKVMWWLRLVHDDATGRMGYAEMYKKNFSLKMLDGLGNVVEKWTFIGAWPTSVDFQDLNYGENDAAQVQFTIRMDSCFLEF